MQKRVACLYRVSTKGQVDKDDIPMQRLECEKFISQHEDWSLYKEYLEKGVSGFKKSAEQRDVLQQIKSDALDGQFDVLLVFMFDRLGRREDETPFILEWFTKQNIEVWSVREGEQKFEQHVDKLINYIRFWQSSGESEKTSIRVDTKQAQMAEEGLFHGGTTPYGYDAVLSGVFNKKRKELLKLQVNEQQAEVVKLIFSCVHDKGMGNYRIANFLNEQGIPSPQDNFWRAGTVGNILRNPIYKGYPAYRKSSRRNIEGIQRMDESKWVYSKEQISDLVIISEQYWDETESIRSKNKTTEGETRNNTKSELLFVGIIFCGYCGSPLHTYHATKTNKNKDGTIKQYPSIKYRCSGKSLKVRDCQGQTTYSANKIELEVLSDIFQYLKLYKETLENMDFNSHKQSKKEIELKIKKLNHKLIQLTQEQDVLTQEISKSLLGTSKFTPDILSKSIESKENEIITIKKELESIKQSTVNIIDVNSQIEKISYYLTNWDWLSHRMGQEVFKMFLRTIVSKIVVYKNSMNIEFNKDLNQFYSVKL